MEANRLTGPALAGAALVISFMGAVVQAADYRTKNFVVSAPTEEIARQIAETAEDSRRELAIAWLGHTLPDWYRPCPVRVLVGQMGAGGATTFTFDRGEVSGWNMRVQGSLERLLDSVIPHEVSHTIFASHFRRPLPRWADEGAATLIEHVEERKRQEVLLNRVIQTSQRIPLDRLLQITEYPSDMQQVYTLYAEGYSLSNFLVQQHGDDGRAVFLKFLQDAHQSNWQTALRRNYQFENISQLESAWTNWVVAGSPPIRAADDPRLATADPQPNRTADDTGDATATARVAVPAGGADERLALATDALAGLPPLPPLGRPFRQLRDEGRLQAPPPGDLGARRGGSEDLVSGLLQERAVAAGRVLPRRDPPPGFDSPLPVASQQWLQQTLAAQPSRPSATARPADPSDAMVRGQSPQPKHWTEFSQFPQPRR